MHLHVRFASLTVLILAGLLFASSADAQIRDASPRVPQLSGDATVPGCRLLGNHGLNGAEVSSVVFVWSSTQ